MDVIVTIVSKMDSNDTHPSLASDFTVIFI